MVASSLQCLLPLHLLQQLLLLLLQQQLLQLPFLLLQLLLQLLQVLHLLLQRVAAVTCALLQWNQLLLLRVSSVLSRAADRLSLQLQMNLHSHQGKPLPHHRPPTNTIQVLSAVFDGHEDNSGKS